MLCACASSLSKALAALGPVGLNANMAAGMSAKLNANASLTAAAKAAATGNAALAANASLSAKLAAVAKAQAKVEALAKLNALASFSMKMKTGFGINLGSSSAPAELSDLLDSLVKNGWNKALSKFPVSATPKLQGLADLASALPAAASLGINTLGPNAQAQLAASAKAAAAANASASAKAAAAFGLSASASASLAAHATAAASASAQRADQATGDPHRLF